MATTKIEFSNNVTVLNVRRGMRNTQLEYHSPKYAGVNAVHGECSKEERLWHQACTARGYRQVSAMIVYAALLYMYSIG